MESYYKLRQLFYYKVRHGLFRIATGITKCIWLLQIATAQYAVLGPRKSAMPLVQDFSENDKMFRREKKYVE